MTATALALAVALQSGDLVTVANVTDRWCARVASIDAGPGGELYAWLTVVSLAYPHAVLRMPVRALVPGCTSPET